MDKIENILICGLGAIGGYYAGKIYKNGNYNLKILVDEERYFRYKNEPRIINGEKIDFNYVLPDNSGFKADLIIIATKSSGLADVIKNIENFVSDNTVILSFLNGISSEKEIAAVYGKEKVLYSFLLGHTFFRKGKCIEHDGQAIVHFGYPNNENSFRLKIVEKFFSEAGISYKIHDDILNALWNKFCFNCCANQLSAITGMTFGEMKNSSKCLEVMGKISSEISKIAAFEGVSKTDEFYNNTLKSLELMIPEGKTSMLQDIEAGVKPEVDIFGKTVVSLGEKYGVDTPFNKVISELLLLIK